jgi:hypothetical protein
MVFLHRSVAAIGLLLCCAKVTKGTSRQRQCLLPHMALPHKIKQNPGLQIFAAGYPGASLTDNRKSLRPLSHVPHACSVLFFGRGCAADPAQAGARLIPALGRHPDHLLNLKNRVQTLLRR